MLYMAQMEVAKELINNNDATVIGILLACIVVLITAIGILWKNKIKDQEYIREQDKENLMMINSLTNTLKTVTDNINDIKTDTSDIKQKVNSVLDIIRERLKNTR